ncbi:MAG: MogA/MoaB family molybdenum cofactor biosynthesis protein [Candidatus Eiseniibacteriota bacterium]
MGVVTRRSGTPTRRAAKGVHAAQVRGERPVACAVLTVSDTRRGADDASGALAERLITRAGHRVVARGWSPDETLALQRSARVLLARVDLDALIVTGGTGVAPRDVTPEAFEPLWDRRLPGFGELFRHYSMREVGAAAWLSRAEAGIARGRLVVLLPGSQSAVRLGLERVLLPELPHVIRMLGRIRTT